MGIVEILILAVGLAMDAFAVAICKGLSVQKTRPHHYLLIGLWFGGFQGLMPSIGYFLGSTFASYIESFSAWVAFALLVLIGGNMIKESLSKDEEKVDASFSFKSMLVLAVATSIDALASGITIALSPNSSSIWLAVLFIGVITFALSALGLKIGNVFGAKFKSKAELFGGIVLIGLGIKILLEYLLK